MNKYDLKTEKNDEKSEAIFFKLEIDEVNREKGNNNNQNKNNNN